MLSCSSCTVICLLVLHSFLVIMCLYKQCKFSGISFLYKSISGSAERLV